MPKVVLNNPNPNNSSPQENLQTLTQKVQEIESFLKSFNPFQNFNNLESKLDKMIQLLESNFKGSSSITDKIKKKSIADMVSEKQKNVNISEQIKEKQSELKFRDKLMSFLSNISNILLQIPKQIFGPIINIFRPFVNLFSTLFGFLNKFVFKSQWFKWLLKSGQLLFRYLYKYVLLQIVNFFLKPLGWLGKGLLRLAGGLFKLLLPILGWLLRGIGFIFTPLLKGVGKLGSLLWGLLVRFAKFLWGGFKTVGSLLWGLLVRFAKFLWGGFKFVGKGAWNLLKRFGNFIWQPLKRLFTPIFKKIWGGLQKILTPIGQGLKKMWGGMKKVFEPIGRGFSNLFNKMKSKVSDKTKPSNWFQSLFKKKKPTETVQSGVTQNLSKQTGGVTSGLQSISIFINSLGTPHQLLGQVTLILIQVQLRILRPIIEKFLEVQGQVFIKQIQQLVDALKIIQDTIKNSIGMFVELVKVVQDLQKQGPDVQKNFNLIATGVVKLGFQFSEFQLQLIGINVQQLGNVITTFIGKLTGQKVPTLVDFIRMFIYDFISPIVEVQKGMTPDQAMGFSILVSSTGIFVKSLNDFVIIIQMNNLMGTINSILSLLNPLNWFGKSKDPKSQTEDNIVHLIRLFINSFIKPLLDLVNKINVNKVKTNGDVLSNITTIFVKQFGNFVNIFNKYKFKDSLNNQISWLNPLNWFGKNKNPSSKSDDNILFLVNTFLHSFIKSILDFITNLPYDINKVKTNGEILSNITNTFIKQFSDFVNIFITYNTKKMIIDQISWLNPSNWFGKNKDSSSKSDDNILFLVNVFLYSFVKPITEYISSFPYDINKVKTNGEILGNITSTFMNAFKTFVGILGEHNKNGLLNNIISSIIPWKNNLNSKDNLNQLLDTFLKSFIGGVINTIIDFSKQKSPETIKKNGEILGQIITNFTSLLQNFLNVLNQPEPQKKESFGEKVRKVLSQINPLNWGTNKSNYDEIKGTIDTFLNSFVKGTVNTLASFTVDTSKLPTISSNISSSLTHMVTLFSSLQQLQDMIDEMKNQAGTKILWWTKPGDMKDVINDIKDAVKEVIPALNDLFKSFPKVNITNMDSISKLSFVSSLLSNIVNILNKLEILAKTKTKIDSSAISNIITTYIRSVTDQFNALNSVNINSLINSYKSFRDKVTKSLQNTGISTQEFMTTLFSFGNLNGFQAGGFTGKGNPNEIQGVVHKGEYVIPSFLMNKYKKIIDQIEKDRLEYLKKNPKLVQFQSGGPTDGGQSFTLSVNRPEGLQISSNFIYIANELKIDNQKVKDIGSQIVMLQLSYMDKFGQENKELKEKFEKITISIITTILEQYSSDEFLQSLNDTLKSVFTSSPVLSQSDLQKILLNQLQEMISKIFESINKKLIEIVDKLEIKNLESVSKLSLNTQSMSNEIVNVVNGVLEHATNLLKVSVVQQFLGSFNVEENLLNIIFKSILPNLATHIVNSTVIIGKTIDETIEKNPKLSDSIKSLYNTTIELIVFSFTIFAESFKDAKELIEKGLGGVIQQLVKTYLKVMALASIINVFIKDFPKLMSDLLSNVVQKLSNTIKQYMTDTWSYVESQILPSKQVLDVNQKPKPTKVQETIQGHIENFFTSLNILTSQVLSIMLDTTSSVMVDIANFLSQDWIKNTIKILEKVLIVLVVGVVGMKLLDINTWKGLANGIGQIVSKFGNIIQNLVNQLENLKVSDDIGNKIVLEFVSFILKLFTSVTNYLFSDQMIQNQQSLIQSDNIVLKQLGYVLPILSVQLLSVITYVITSISGSITTLFANIFTTDNINKFQSNLDSESMASIIVSVIQGVFNIFSQVISGQLSLVSSNSSSSGSLQAFGPVGAIIGAGIGLVMDALKIAIMGQMVWILGIVGTMISNVAPVLSNLFSTLFSQSNLSKINPETKEYQELTFSIVNQVVNFMFNLTMKIVDFQIGSNNSGFSLDSLNIFSMVSNFLMSFMKMFIIMKLSSIIDSINVIFSGVQNIFSTLFKNLFSESKISSIPSNTQEYQNLVFDMVKQVLNFMFNLTFKLIDYQMTPNNRSTGILDLFTGKAFIDAAMEGMKLIILAKVSTVLDIFNNIFDKISNGIGTIVDNLFTQDKISSLQTGDSYQSLVFSLVNTVLNFMMNMVTSLITYQIGQDNQQSGGGGGRRGIIGFLKDKEQDKNKEKILNSVLKLVDAIVPMFYRVGRQIGNLFNYLFSESNINKIQTSMIESGQLQNLAVNIIQSVITLMMDVTRSLFSNIDVLKEMMVKQVDTRSLFSRIFGLGRGTLNNFNETVNKIFTIMQNNIDKISNIQIILIDKIFTTDNINKYINDDLIQVIMKDLTVQIVSALLTPFYSLIGTQQQQQQQYLLNAEVVTGVKTVEAPWWKKIFGIQNETVVETQKLSDLLSQKTSILMGNISKGLLIQLDTINRVVTKYDFGLTFVQQFEQSMDNLVTQFENLITNSINFNSLYYELDYQSQKIRFRVDTINNLKSETETLKLQLMNEQNELLSDIKQEIIRINQKLDTLQVNNSNNNTSSLSNNLIEKLTIGV